MKCGLAILLSILALAFDSLSGGTLNARIPRLTFYGESTALIAFGISWLTASRVLPWLMRQDEASHRFVSTIPPSSTNGRGPSSAASNGVASPIGSFWQQSSSAPRY